MSDKRVVIIGHLPHGNVEKMLRIIGATGIKVEVETPSVFMLEAKTVMADTFAFSDERRGRRRGQRNRDRDWK
jgi:hypothetical protein